VADRTVPNLPSRDFDATVDFYGRFGFVPTYRDDGWLILKRGSLVLEFFPFPTLDPYESSFMCSIRVADLEELHSAITKAEVPSSKAGIPRLTPIENGSWGQRVAYLVDLDGTQLHLIEHRGD